MAIQENIVNFQKVFTRSPRGGARIFTNIATKDQLDLLNFLDEADQILLLQTLKILPIVGMLKFLENGDKNSTRPNRGAQAEIINYLSMQQVEKVMVYFTREQGLNMLEHCSEQYVSSKEKIIAKSYPPLPPLKVSAKHKKLGEIPSKPSHTLPTVSTPAPSNKSKH